MVGGGVTGVGVALEAASRGHHVALLERDDLGAGTSSRSSRLIHGGLRYLEQYRFGLVREALAERRALLRLAPHLVRLQSFLVPIIGSPLQVPFIGAGLTCYGLLGAAADGGFPRYLTPASAVRRQPALRRGRLRGAMTYHDAVEDDARIVIGVARTAAREGAIVATRIAARELLTVDGRTVGVGVEDVIAGRQFEVRARAVVDATGALGGRTGPFGVGAPDDMRPSRGSHILVPRDRIPGDDGMTIRLPGRVAFLIPWDEHLWLIGTTDHLASEPLDRTAATSAEVDELLSAVHAALDVDLGRSDIVATYAGIRPLADTGAGSTLRASREHVIHEPVPGLFAVRGGKFTTFRRMARDVLKAVADHGRIDPRPSSPTTFIGTPLTGLDIDAIAASHGLQPPGVTRLSGRYGAETVELLELGQARGQLQPLPGADYLEIEATWAVEHEYALDLDDVLARRLRLATETRDHGAVAADRVAQLIGPALGWTPERAASEVTRYAEGARREYGVPA